MSRRESIQLLALLASFVVAGYAAIRLVAGNPIGTGTWFVGSAVVHDLVLFPLYAGLDAALVRWLRQHPERAAVAGVPWLNYLRVPAAVCGVLLLVWSPLILRLPTALQEKSGLSEQPFLPHWLAVTAVLFAISATILALRVATIHLGNLAVWYAARSSPEPCPAPDAALPAAPAPASAQAQPADMIIKVEIRRARQDELPQLLVLAQAFYREDGFATPLAELRDNLETLLQAEATRVAVAVEGGIAVGFAITTTGFGLEQGRLAELQDLYVIPDRRGHGLGRALLDDSATWAHDQGARQLEVVIALGGHDVTALLTYYTRQGFADQGRRLLTRILATVDPRL